MIQQSAAWQNLFSHQTEFNGIKLADLLLDTSLRQSHYELSAVGLTVDFSKTHTRDETWRLLDALAKAARVDEKKRDLFAGKLVNCTENRPALHGLLRKSQISGSFEAKQGAIFGQQEKAKHFCEQCDEAIIDIIHVGIGGSALGPELISEALKPYYQNERRCHFIQNLDPAEWVEKLETLNPATTLLIVVSKSFTTEETLVNARAVKKWMQSSLSEAEIKKRIVAVTANQKKAEEEGFLEEAIFNFDESIGGRFSVWSCVSLSVMLCIGYQQFKAFLEGAELMDQHFLSEPVLKNIPVRLALLDIWYRNFFDIRTHAIVPYSYHLRSLPKYLQQVIMESNGKSVNLENEIISHKTAPVVWGSEGTNSQHSFHQWLHQGTDLTLVDFIVSKKSHYDSVQHAKLYANCLAQIEVLCYGDKQEQVYQSLPGNKPSVLMSFDLLTPKILGALLALYEHRIFTQSVIWQINAFDQWGVEAGKKLSLKKVSIEQ